ncbi:hypothetical protein PgNI_06029 [Pyricularia grisea]|uniref:Uncharacterized protein n=1 Tax=Pyricularia grisea TaxID=148305 RepID=A0A6P8B538_PYRGI|nr:hypothetical protein PgNI_06029 [Pyricularia grisea]TLD10239.1 hypothetical protein PgNI_06029 [Pyricularia grisea]
MWVKISSIFHRYICICGIGIPVVKTIVFVQQTVSRSPISILPVGPSFGSLYFLRSIFSISLSPSSTPLQGASAISFGCPNGKVITRPNK